jgi:RNA polymerase sigma-70 factor, ECF subfamily
VLRRYMSALERSDVAALAELLHADVRGDMPPIPYWFEGREANLRALGRAFEPGNPCYGDRRLVPTGANLQPAAALYLRRPGDSEYRAQSINVLRIADGKVIAGTAFDAGVFPAFGLPPVLTR